MIGSLKNHCDEGVSASVIELVEQCCFFRGIEATITKKPDWCRIHRYPH
ncbi:IS660 transposase [Bacillus cereus]|nr:IS660 transposase [Bacillus cereus]